MNFKLPKRIRIDFAKVRLKAGYSEEYIDAVMLSKYSVSDTKKAIEKAKEEILNERK